VGGPRCLIGLGNIRREKVEYFLKQVYQEDNCSTAGSGVEWGSRCMVVVEHFEGSLHTQDMELDRREPQYTGAHASVGSEEAQRPRLLQRWKTSRLLFHGWPG
jgi:hypothetical protein